MNCIHCGAWTQVVRTSPHGKYGIKRARRCGNLCPIFQTYEVIGTVYTHVKARLGDAHRTAERRALLFKRDRGILGRLDKGVPGTVIARELGISTSSVSLVKRARDKALRDAGT